MSLQDQQVVITGASSGMGLATAKAANEAGAKVTIKFEIRNSKFEIRN